MNLNGFPNLGYMLHFAGVETVLHNLTMIEKLIRHWPKEKSKRIRLKYTPLMVKAKEIGAYTLISNMYVLSGWKTFFLSSPSLGWVHACLQLNEINPDSVVLCQTWERTRTTQTKAKGVLLKQCNEEGGFCSIKQTQCWRGSTLHQKLNILSLTVHAKSLQSCLTLCNPMDYTLPGSSIHGTLQARIQIPF